MKASVFPVYIVWASLREQFLSCNGAVNFCFLNSYNMDLVKIKEDLQFLPLILSMLCIANKQMHDKHKDQLPLPQAR